MAADASSPGLIERRACPVCLSRSGATLLDLSFDREPMRSYIADFYRGRLDPGALGGGRYRLIECDDCGLVYQASVPNSALLDLLYSVAAAIDPDERAAARGLDVRLWYAHDIEQLLRHVGGPPGEVEVLDFGSGSGDWLQMAAAFGAATTGCELTAEGRASTAAGGHRVVDLEVMPEGRFHFVNAEQVVEHLVEPAAVVSTLARSLRPGGILRLSVPNGTGIRERLARADWGAPKGSHRSLNAVAPLEHLNCFDHRSLRRLGVSSELSPFRYPLRTEIHPLGRIRYIASALAHRVRPPATTIQLFRRT